MNKLHIVAVVAGLALSYCSANATNVTGKITLTQAAKEGSGINRYPGREGLSDAEMSMPMHSTKHGAIVYLVGGAKSNYTLPKANPQMEQIGQAFNPTLLPILVGTTVDFPNSDPIFHNVFSYSKTKKFDLGRYSKGESKSVTFDKPGLIKVFCEIHPSMRAHILVLEQPYFTVTDEDGNFRIENVPPGSYELCVWQEQSPETKTPIKVPEQESFSVDVK